jgi:transcriptional regulator with XRE-family HTH domain
MSRRIQHLLPAADHILVGLGMRIAIARGRRRITRKQLAQRAGLTEFTLRRVERGEGTATIAAYAAVLHALGMSADLDRVAADDPLGRDLQDAPLIEGISRRPAPRPRLSSTGSAPPAPSRPPASFPTRDEQLPRPLSTNDIVRLLSGPEPAVPSP